MAQKSLLTESEQKAYKLITRIQLRNKLKDINSQLIFHALQMSILSKRFKMKRIEVKEYKMKFNNIDFDTYFKNYPNNEGYFGKYGGAYVNPELKKAMDEITEAYFTICKSSKFIAELRKIRKEFQGRPTPISYLERLSSTLGNVQLYVKREHRCG